jgi:hypothetical protein
LYHERAKIIDRLIKQNLKNNKMEMRAQIVANVIPIFVALAQKICYITTMLELPMQELPISKWN